MRKIADEHKDLLPGGLADKNKPSDFPKAQLLMGIKVEREHTKNFRLAREIAMDHLKEDPHYYSKLRKMEKKAASLKWVAGKTQSGTMKQLKSALDEFKQAREAFGPTGTLETGGTYGRKQVERVGRFLKRNNEAIKRIDKAHDAGKLSKEQATKSIHKRMLANDVAENIGKKYDAAVERIEKSGSIAKEAGNVAATVKKVNDIAQRFGQTAKGRARLQEFANRNTRKAMTQLSDAHPGKWGQVGEKFHGAGGTSTRPVQNAQKRMAAAGAAMPYTVKQGSLSKEAALTDEQKARLKRYGAIAAGGLGAAGLAAGGIALGRTALRRHIAADIKAFGTKGGAHAVDRAKALPQEAIAQAKAVADSLRARGIDPSKARIAVSGTGGTGKTTLSRALAEELKMKPLMMDDVGKSLSGRDLPKWLKKNKVAPGTIAEQTHLINQVDPDKFDAIIRIHKPMKDVKKQIIKRGRGAGQLEVYDYDKLHKSIDTAFHRTSGQHFDVGNNIQIKVRPQGGFKADSHLNEAIKGHGLDPSKMTRQQKVYAAAHGKKPVGPGVFPYVKTKRIAAGAGIVGGTGAAGAVGTKMFMDKDKPKTAMYAGFVEELAALME